MITNDDVKDWKYNPVTIAMVKDLELQYKSIEAALIMSASDEEKLKWVSQMQAMRFAINTIKDFSVQNEEG